MHVCNRRTFLSFATAASGALVESQASARTTQKKGKAALGIQLWAVREDCARDMDATLQWVADAGFKGVEFAGFHKYEGKPEALRKRLDDLGLAAEGSHTGVRAFSKERLQATIETFQALKCPFLIVGGDKRFTDASGSRAYADEMNEASQALKPHGLFCGHHNHTEEFTKVGDTTYFDLFAKRTIPDVILQLDIGWALTAEVDPIALMKRHAGRFKTLHIRGKHGADPIIGRNNFAWRPLLDAATKFGGAQWLMLEQEEYPEGLSPMKSSELSLAGLKKILGRS